MYNSGGKLSGGKNFRGAGHGQPAKNGGLTPTLDFQGPQLVRTEKGFWVLSRSHGPTAVGKRGRGGGIGGKNLRVVDLTVEGKGGADPDGPRSPRIKDRQVSRKRTGKTGLSGETAGTDRSHVYQKEARRA